MTEKNLHESLADVYEKNCNLFFPIKLKKNEKKNHWTLPGH